MSEFSATIVVVENENDQTITFCFGNSEELSQRVKFDRSILPSFANLISQPHSSRISDTDIGKLFVCRTEVSGDWNCAELESGWLN